MKEGNGTQNGALKTLEYVLQDFLELKASLGKEKAEPLKRFLFSHEMDHCVMRQIDGFSLGKQLVLLSEIGPDRFERLIFVDPQRGRLQVRTLQNKTPK